MDILFFIIKYTPFWGIPCAVIGVAFCYAYWIKDVRPIAILFAGLTGVSLLCCLAWFWTGGPEGSVRYIQRAIQLEEK